MILCYIFLVISVVRSEELKDLNVNEFLQLIDDVSRARTGDVKDDDVVFLLFSRSVNNEILISNKTNDNISLHKPTKFIIHGWIANARRSWNKKMTEAFLKQGDYNIIQVNWERVARMPYISSAKNTKLIGQRISKFILDTNMLPDDVHLIGHSLGAHVAGYAAKKVREATGQKIARISGLDPAGPYFRQYAFVKEERLDKNDAKIVDVIHTDAGMYGIEFPVGTLDIFVNGGRAPQPSCLLNFNAASFLELLDHSYCSHSKSIDYFIEWINDGKFRCNMCSKWQNLLARDCNKTLTFREEDVTENIRGICFTDAHGQEPYLSN